MFRPRQFGPICWPGGTGLLAHWPNSLESQRWGRRVPRSNLTQSEPSNFPSLLYSPKKMKIVGAHCRRSCSFLLLHQVAALATNQPSAAQRNVSAGSFADCSSMARARRPLRMDLWQLLQHRLFDDPSVRALTNESIANSVPKRPLETVSV